MAEQSKKAIYLNQGRQGLDPSQIKAADILFKDIAIKYKDAPKSTEPINKTLFLFWWDGFDSAPEIVKLCVKSVIKNYPDYNIILLDKNKLKRVSSRRRYRLPGIHERQNNNSKLY